jgi:hypothetical protein
MKRAQDMSGVATISSGESVAPDALMGSNNIVALSMFICSIEDRLLWATDVAGQGSQILHALRR